MDRRGNIESGKVYSLPLSSSWYSSSLMSEVKVSSRRRDASGGKFGRVKFLSGIWAASGKEVASSGGDLTGEVGVASVESVRLDSGGDASDIVVGSSETGLEIRRRSRRSASLLAVFFQVG